MQRTFQLPPQAPVTPTPASVSVQHALRGKEPLASLTRKFALLAMLRDFMTQAVVVPCERFGTTHRTREILLRLSFVCFEVDLLRVHAFQNTTTGREWTRIRFALAFPPGLGLDITLGRGGWTGGSFIRRAVMMRRRWRMRFKGDLVVLWRYNSGG